MIRSLALATAAAGLAALVPLASAAPASVVVDRASITCSPISSVGLRGTTAARIQADDVQRRYLPVMSCDYANRLVRRVGRGGIQEPFDDTRNTECNVSINGNRGRWTCQFFGAGGATDVTINFSVRYA